MGGGSRHLAALESEPIPTGLNLRNSRSGSMRRLQPLGRDRTGEMTRSTEDAP